MVKGEVYRLNDSPVPERSHKEYLGHSPTQLSFAKERSQLESSLGARKKPKRFNFPEASIALPPLQPNTSGLPARDFELKENAYRQLDRLLAELRLLRFYVLVEGLHQRFPDDVEVSTWLAIVYRFVARDLADRDELEKALIYLERALGVSLDDRVLEAAIRADLALVQQAMDRA